MQAVIRKHSAEGKIVQARRSASETHTSVRVHKEKQVWVWDGLRQAIDTDELFTRFKATCPTQRDGELGLIRVTIQGDQSGNLRRRP